MQSSLSITGDKDGMNEVCFQSIHSFYCWKNTDPRPPSKWLQMAFSQLARNPAIRLASICNPTASQRPTNDNEGPRYDLRKFASFRAPK